jgi:hypothetical protein
VIIAAPATTSPPPRTAVPGVPAGQILHSVWAGIWSTATGTPWIGALLAVVVIVGTVRFARSIIHNGPRDPVRRFSRADKTIILYRAGGQCEHHYGIFGRCQATEKLEADHIHPHSRGGWTNISNGQALCKQHNREKRATVPFNRQLRALEKRRADYFPNSADGSVVRRNHSVPGIQRSH